ncbi:MAG: tetratricopeptide repeat protein [Luteolibacter sp.]
MESLSGYHLNPDTQSLIKTPNEIRLQHLSKLIPEIPATISNHSAAAPLEKRLAAAYPNEYPNISAPEIALATIVQETFASQDPAAISALISALPPQGLGTATALYLSLKSGKPAYISQAFGIAQELPPAIAQLATTPRSPETLATLREEQDWLGYEAPDFTEIVPLIQQQKATILDELILTENPTDQEIQEIISQLLSPALLQKFPRETLAATAIANATRLASSHETATAALQLTAVAQRLGTPPPEILRTKALAFTSLADFQTAHRTWLDLITNQPQATHHPSDYSEASYTAFENADPRQAMEILRTGLFRFPNDVALAIRAAWISLLTDHPEEAAAYLTKASSLGIPGNEVEDTTLLLTITNTQLGNIETAEAHLAQLQAINPAWKDPEAIETLPWPEPLKAPLRQLLWQP